MGNNARKYVDLLHKATGGKHANWDPPKLVEVGDWGYVDQKTAAFVKEGNIFTDPECSDALENLDKRVLYSSPEDVIRFDANAVSTGGGNISAGLGATGDVGIKVDVAWTFSPKNRGAVITASDVSTAYLETGIIFPRLDKIKKLKDKAVVVETLTCPAYALLLTDKGRGGSASVTLETWVSGAGVSVGPGIGGRWKAESQTGVWRTAYGYRTDERAAKDVVFTPLFKLRTTNRRLRWPAAPIYRGAITHQYEEYELPWKALDEDGEEEDVVDDVTDSPVSALY
ncbi:hypothetical protein FRC12_017175 [Ceratobasidium sp. 428]|nr:hypothetical protein FRC12_017175 [Ceratobasidium sp. 428]